MNPCTRAAYTFSLIVCSKKKPNPHHLQSWTKALGQIYICGALSHAPNEQPGNNSSTYVQPPPPPPLYYVGHVYTLFLQRFIKIIINKVQFSLSSEVQHCMGRGGGGRGGIATHFETENSAFLKLRFKHTEN